MALAGMLAGAAERHALVERAVVADLGGLTDDDAAAVVDHQSLADFGAGVDLDAGEKLCALADGARTDLVPVRIERMGGAVQQHGVQSRVEQEHLKVARCGGVAVAEGGNVVFHRFHRTFHRAFRPPEVGQREVYVQFKFILHGCPSGRRYTL